MALLQPLLMDGCSEEPAGNPALLLQQPHAKPWAALPSKWVSKAPSHYIEIIRMLLVTHPSGPASAAIRCLRHNDSSLTLTPIIPISSLKTTHLNNRNSLDRPFFFFFHLDES